MNTPTGVLTPEALMRVESIRKDLRQAIIAQSGGPTYDDEDFLLAIIDRLTASAEQARREVLEETGKVVTIGSIRLQRILRGSTEFVTVEVEIDGAWVEVIRELHSNYFDHFVSPSGIRALIKTPSKEGE